MTVDDQPLKMEVDTGAAYACIPKRLYQERFPNKKLRPTTLRLCTYTGEVVNPEGVFTVKVSHNGQQCDLDMYVVKHGQSVLLGREWLYAIKLDWGAIHAMTATNTAKPKPIEDQMKTHVTPKKTVQARIDGLMKKYSKVTADGLGKVQGIKATLTIQEGCQPKFCKARPVPYALKPKIEAELERLQAEGIISPVDYSEWASPIVPAAKKTGDVRICGDFKITINPVLQGDKYPLPKIEDIFAQLSGGKKFTKIDLSNAYLQMEMEEESKPYITINTHKGLFRYNRLPFGIKTAPAIWQKVMDQTLQGIPGVQCLLDDIIVTGHTDEEHLKNLELVLQRLSDRNMRLNLKKCKFFQDKVEYCGHEIDQYGLHKTKEKIEAIVSAPQPEDVSSLRSFLGLVNYYHKFLPNLATVLAPLNHLLENATPWKWTTDCDKAFNEAKKMVSSEQVLTHYNPDLPLRVACDASPYGLGAVLSHTMPDGAERPIAFASRTLTKSEKNYSQIDKEALALVWGVKKFHHYIYGRKFTLITDHQPLTAILHPEKGIPALSAARMQRYALILAAHDYNIVYKSTKKHTNADGLSRLPLGNTVNYVEDIVDLFHTAHLDQLPVTTAAIKKATRRDPVLARVYEATMNGWPEQSPEGLTAFHSRRAEISLHQDCLMWGIRVIVPSTLQKQVLDELHTGHLGVVKMKSLARSYVWWPGIDNDLEVLARNCTGCQQIQNNPRTVPLHPWEWPAKPWQRIHVDYAGPFLGYMFLVIVDAKSKWPEVVMTTSTTSEKTVEILRNVFSRNGLPEILVSDNGPQFTSQEFQHFLQMNGIHHITSAPYHPATNGLAERFVQTFKQGLRAVKDDPGTVQQKLSRFLMAYRNTPHSTTGEVPSVLFMGRRLRTRLDALKPDVRRHVVHKQMDTVEAKGGVPRQFQVGDSVAVREYLHDRKWVPAVIHQKTGTRSYEVEVEPGRIWRRHADQIRRSEMPMQVPKLVHSDLPSMPSPAELPSEVPQVPSDSTPSSAVKPSGQPVPPQVEPPRTLRRSQRQRRAPQRLDL
jgi:hypothetical protein